MLVILITFVFCTTLLSASPVASPSAFTVSPAEFQAFTQEVGRLRAIVVDQQKQISQQQGALRVLTEKGEGTNTALFTAVGVIIASWIAGYFALRNQNNQAAQGRLLKSVELIMESRSNYQADMRRQNLSVFLDAETKEHLKDIKTTFSGPEFTDIHLQLAQSMASKAQSPQEVLDIWQSVLSEKNVINKVKFQKTA